MESSTCLASPNQLQMSRLHSVNFSPDSPHLDLKSASGSVQVPLSLADGLYSVSLEPISVNDVRYGTHPRFDLTAKGEYSPPTVDGTCLATQEGVSPLGNWTCRLLVAPSSSHRVMAFPTCGSSVNVSWRLCPFLLHAVPTTRIIRFTCPTCPFVSWARHTTS